MSFLKLTEVSKTFGSTRALEPLSLDVAEGEFVVLVGPSGCGKSTLLRIIAGLEKATTGKIFLDQRCINELEPGQRDIAMVFQNYALYPHMKVKDNLSFALKLRHYSRQEISHRTQEASELLGIAEMMNRYPRELSGGERQRVAVGRAIVRHPKIFLFDEPLSNLDAKLRVQMRSEISRLHKKLEVTMIYVTHDQTEAMTMGDRIVVLKADKQKQQGGTIQQIGTPMELYHTPENKFVAEFIGSPAMNIIEKVKLNDQGKVETDVIPNLIYNTVNSKGTSTVDIGFRPEKVDLIRSAGSSKGVEMDIELVERMGSETILHLSTGPVNITAVVYETLDFKVGEKIRIGVDAKNLFLFDPASGKVLY